MAGFAIAVTIAIYGIIALIGTAILTHILRVRAANRDRDGTRGRGAMIVATWAPLAALLWVVVAFRIHLEISNRIAHQDSGLSADPYVTLPNGYVLGSYNTYDGYIVAPGHAMGEPIAGPGYVRTTSIWTGRSDFTAGRNSTSRRHTYANSSLILERSCSAHSGTLVQIRLNPRHRPTSKRGEML